MATAHTELIGWEIRGRARGIQCIRLIIHPKAHRPIDIWISIDKRLCLFIQFFFITPLQVTEHSVFCRFWTSFSFIRITYIVIKFRFIIYYAKKIFSLLVMFVYGFVDPNKTHMYLSVCHRRRAPNPLGAY